MEEDSDMGRGWTDQAQVELVVLVHQLSLPEPDLPTWDNVYVFAPVIELA